MTGDVVRGEEFVKSEVLEALATAVELGLVEDVAFVAADGVLHAETYTEGGEVEARWIVELTVRPDQPQ